MDYHKFTELSDMLIEGMESAIKISHNIFTREEYANRVGLMILQELEKDDSSLNKMWTEKQVPGLRDALNKVYPTTPEQILRLSAPGLVALSSESSEQIKNLAYHVTYNAFVSLNGEKLR